MSDAEKRFHKAKMRDVSRIRSIAAKTKKFRLEAAQFGDWLDGCKVDDYGDIYRALSEDCKRLSAEMYALSEIMRDMKKPEPSNVIDIHDHLRKCGKG